MYGIYLKLAQFLIYILQIICYIYICVCFNNVKIEISHVPVMDNFTYHHLYTYNHFE